MRQSTLLLVGLIFIASNLSGQPPAKPKAATFSINEKTLVAWVRLAKLTQHGGSALTVETPDGDFDGIVFGERETARWMAGSEFFHRTADHQAAWPAETSNPSTLIQIAVVYSEKTVRIYRDAQLYAEYQLRKNVAFDESMIVVMGLRHLEASDRACLVGEIEDARVYNRALDQTTISQLRRKEPNGPQPLGWWDFSTGFADDRMGRFPRGRLVGGARIERGRLILPGGLSYLVINAPLVPTRQTELWPRWHVSARPEEGVALPYDANGCIYWKGKYHLMYIFQDPKLPHGGHCWGHLSSTDLINWTYHPPAVVPAKGDPDVGIFSGNAFINKDGVPMLCWFGINAGVCAATAEDDDLIVWKKHPANPIVPIPKPGQPGHGRYTVWDPYLWWQDGKYWCLLGGNTLPNKKDTLYLLTSPDLVKWTPRHPFFEHADLTWTTEGEDCSCPDFFPLGNKHALLCISHKVGARLYLGKFDTQAEKFIPDQHIRFNWPGGHYFAPESLIDDRGRRIVWAWITDPRRMSTQRATGSGIQGLPRVLSLDENGNLLQRPVEELEALRMQSHTIAGHPLLDGKEIKLKATAGPSNELTLDFDINQALSVTAKVLCAQDSGEETSIRYEPVTKMLVVDVSRSTKRKDVKYSAGPLDGYGNTNHPVTKIEAPLVLLPQEPLRLHIFIDGPVLEIFANQRQCITLQVYPQSNQAHGISVGSEGGSAELLTGSCWELKAAQFRMPKH
jgi:sucrose-6-phosphate hydrolase SacC (GH32 family)